MRNENVSYENDDDILNTKELSDTEILIQSGIIPENRNQDTDQNKSH